MSHQSNENRWQRPGGGRYSSGGGYPPRQGGGRSSGGFQPQLPDGYLQEGYFNYEGRPHKELFIGWPEQIANGLKQGHMSSSALRNFYNEAKTILSVAEGQKEDEHAFENVKERIWMLKARAYHASQKKDSSVTELFVKFIEANLPFAEQSLKAYKAFVSHFECVVAFSKEKE